jgi:ketosteroid isomerase-like protein
MKAKQWPLEAGLLRRLAPRNDEQNGPNSTGRITGGEIMSKDIEQLTVLNRDYVASVQNSDVKRFGEILAEDFYCTNPDKSLVDRAGFLKQTAVPVTIKNLEAHDVKIRVMGDFAIIHAATSYTTPVEAGFGALHRLLGAAKRPLARGLRACIAVTH